MKKEVIMGDNYDPTKFESVPIQSAPLTGSGEIVHGFTLPEGKDASDLDWWPEFVTYFERKEGCTPHPRDTHTKLLFEYFVEGAYQQFQQSQNSPINKLGSD